MLHPYEGNLLKLAKLMSLKDASVFKKALEELAKKNGKEIIKKSKSAASAAKSAPKGKAVTESVKKKLTTLQEIDALEKARKAAASDIFTDITALILS